MNKPEYFICENADKCKFLRFCSHRQKHEELPMCFAECSTSGEGSVPGSTCISYDNYLAKKNKESLLPIVPIAPSVPIAPIVPANIVFQLSIQWSNGVITVSRHKTRKDAEAMVIEVIDASDDTAQNGYVTLISISQLQATIPNTTNPHQLY